VSTNRFVRIIETLSLHEVRFIIVGGVAAVLQRVPVNTVDFDILYDCEPENVQRLLSALALLGAVLRDQPGHQSVSEQLLLSSGMHRLHTEHLDLDAMSKLQDGSGYRDLLSETDKIDVAGYVVDVLKLEKLIELKQHLTRAKDRFLLVHMQATLEERNRMR
jgi:Nucleotidyl transferase of unknown function (DUF2204)